MLQPVVLWDMDGVLILSEPLHVEKLIVVAARHGVTIKEEDFTRPHTFRVPDAHGVMNETTMTLGGAGDKNIYYWLLAQKPELENSLSKQQWLDELLEYYITHKDRLVPREHMVELVHSFGRERTIQGIVTSGIPAQLEANLAVMDETAKKMGFGNHQVFRQQMLFTLNADQVKVSKPNPEGYLIGIQHVLTELQAQKINPANAIYVAVEDSVPGVAAGLAAGPYCVQFLLPGQHAVGVGPELQDRFRAATTGREVEAQIRVFFARARKEISQPRERHPNAPQGNVVLSPSDHRLHLT